MRTRWMTTLILVAAIAPLRAQEPRPVPKPPVEEADQPEPALRRAFLELLGELAKAERAESRARDAVAEAVAMPEKARRTEELGVRVRETKQIRRRLADLRAHPSTRAIVRKSATIEEAWHHFFVGIGPEWVARKEGRVASPADGRPDPASPSGRIVSVFWSAVDVSSSKLPTAFTLVFAIEDTTGARRGTVRVAHRALEHWRIDRTTERVTLVPIAMPKSATKTWRVELIAIEKPKPKPDDARTPAGRP